MEHFCINMFKKTFACFVELLTPNISNNVQNKRNASFIQSICGFHLVICCCNFQVRVRMRLTKFKTRIQLEFKDNQLEDISSSKGLGFHNV